MSRATSDRTQREDERTRESPGNDRGSGRARERSYLREHLVARAGGNAAIQRRLAEAGGGRAATADRSRVHVDTEPRIRRSVYGRQVIQPKLEVNEPGDEYEREADRVAKRVMGMPDSNPSSLSRSRAPLDHVPQADAKPGGTATNTGLPGELPSLRGGGRPLPDSLRSFFEPRFDHDFGAVRVHTGPRADEAARAIDAEAFTHGNDVVFRSDAYRPRSTGGRQLLAHELVHVIQQRTAQPPQFQRQFREYYERGRRFLGEKAEQVESLFERGRERVEPLVERGQEMFEQGVERAERGAERAMEEARRWWSSGSGKISQIKFDGSTVKLIGDPGYSASAISGLRPGAKPQRKREAGLEPSTDCTKPEYQDVPDVGPIPEGSYYLEPSEVESEGFDTGVWGHYRTRLHESLLTTFARRAWTDRTGGFFLHQDANGNGTAGCIGVVGAGDNRKIHEMIKANTAPISVTVSYPSSTSEQSTGSDAGATVQRREATEASSSPSRNPDGLLRVQRQVVQRQEAGSESEASRHYLVRAGIDRLNEDASTYSTGDFPGDYYETLARHLFERALEATGRDYGDAFSLLNDLQWGEFGPELREEYEQTVGTDSENGWDKFRHFVYTACLQYKSGGFLAPEVFTYGKEVWDELEGLVGEDPEGYSQEDVTADTRGEVFAEEMRERERRENRARLRRELDAARRALEGDPRALEWLRRGFTGGY